MATNRTVRRALQGVCVLEPTNTRVAPRKVTVSTQRRGGWRRSDWRTSHTIATFRFETITPVCHHPSDHHAAFFSDIAILDLEHLFWCSGEFADMTQVKIVTVYRSGRKQESYLGLEEFLGQLMRRGHAEDFVLVVREGEVRIRQFATSQNGQQIEDKNDRKATEGSEGKEVQLQTSMEEKRSKVCIVDRSDISQFSQLKNGDKDKINEAEEESEGREVESQTSMEEEARSDICIVDSDDVPEISQLESEDEVSKKLKESEEEEVSEIKEEEETRSDVCFVDTDDIPQVSQMEGDENDERTSERKENEENGNQSMYISQIVSLRTCNEELQVAEDTREYDKNIRDEKRLEQEGEVELEKEKEKLLDYDMKLEEVGESHEDALSWVTVLRWIWFAMELIVMVNVAVIVVLSILNPFLPHSLRRQ